MTSFVETKSTPVSVEAYDERDLKLRLKYTAFGARKQLYATEVLTKTNYMIIIADQWLPSRTTIVEIIDGGWVVSFLRHSVHVQWCSAVFAGRSVIFACFSGGRELLPMFGRLLWTRPSF